MESTIVLLTAARAREIATDIRNEEMAKCLKTLMDQIKDTAEKGGVKKYVNVFADRPDGFFELLENTFCELGYGFHYKGKLGNGCKQYLITW